AWKSRTADLQNRSAGLRFPVPARRDAPHGDSRATSSPAGSPSGEPVDGSLHTREVRGSKPGAPMAKRLLAKRQASRRTPGDVARVASGEGVELAVGQLDAHRADVLPEVLERQRSGDREHRWRAPQEPGQGDLGGARAASLGDLLEGWAGGAEGEVGDEGDALARAVVEHLLVPSL